MTTYQTKPGKYGTLYLYEIPYVDTCDADNHGTFRTWAYDAEHAVDNFWSGGAEDEGWTTNGSAKRVKA